MSRARHRAKGGRVTAYAGGDSNVMKEAHERKRGGRVGEGSPSAKKGDKKGRARGGAVPAKATGGAVAAGGTASAAGAGVPGRKRGGGVGSNLRPLSTAASTKKLGVEEAGTEGGGHKGSNVPNP